MEARGSRYINGVRYFSSLTRHGPNAKVRLSLASSSYGFFLWNYTETHERSFSNITTKDDLRMEGRKTVMPSSSDI